MHPFEQQLAIDAIEMELALTAFQAEAWLDFWLNPRRLRGSDFLMRWSQVQKQEDRGPFAQMAERQLALREAPATDQGKAVRPANHSHSK